MLNALPLVLEVSATQATWAKFVIDEMFIEASKKTANRVTEKHRNFGLLFPPQSDILENEVQTAQHMAVVVFYQNLALVDRPNNIDAWLCGMFYRPDYVTFSTH
jgi:malate dehydrogenase (oxaloacetate-decarboxylating)(NADP+)